MLTKWIDRVRKSGQLTVFADDSAAGWTDALRRARHVFNAVSSSAKLGVRLVGSTQPPDLNAEARGDVAHSGADVLFTIEGVAFHIIEGRTRYRANTNDRNIMVKARIILPTPMVKSGTDMWDREAGDGVKMILALHELIHACGLSNHEHTLGEPDVFCGVFDSIKANSIFREDDTIVKDKTEFPPATFSARTLNFIRANWS